jgi:hypothetical protein
MRTEERHALWDKALNEALEAARKERFRHLDKWSFQRHTLAEWVSILTEEVGALAKEVNDASFMGGSNNKELKAQSAQVAAVALAIFQQIDNQYV